MDQNPPFPGSNPVFRWIKPQTRWIKTRNNRHTVDSFQHLSTELGNSYTKLAWFKTRSKKQSPLTITIAYPAYLDRRMVCSLD
jgi:hypothetical protein